MCTLILVLILIKILQISSQNIVVGCIKFLYIGILNFLLVEVVIVKFVYYDFPETVGAVAQACKRDGCAFDSNSG